MKTSFNKIFFPIFSIITIFLSSCSTDVDINGKWKDIPVIYCILDQSQEYQYVKVNKSFLGKAAASEMAQITDSLFYKKVDVVIEEWQNNSKINSYVFTPVDTIPKVPGYFGNSKNTIWVCKMNLNNSSSYKLHVNIDDGKHIASSETKLVDGIRIVRPSAYLPSVDIFSYNNDWEFEYSNGNNGKIFQMAIVFNYIEVYPNGDTIDKHLTWKLNKQYRTTIAATDIKNRFSVLAFYAYLSNNIPKSDGNIIRLVKMPNSIEFRLTAADENYNTFMEVTAPSSGLVQENASYTNIQNGYGIFAARYTSISKKKFGTRTLDSIHRGIYTRELGFVDPFNNYYTK